MADETRNGRLSIGTRLLAVTLFAIGFAVRISPLVDHRARLFTQFPSEDGYLMLTIARNIALGRGMSIAAGTIPTNGTHPFSTFLWAGVFRLFDADRELGVAGVSCLEILIASLAAWALYRLGRRAFARRPYALEASLLAAATWYSSALGLRHTMNCLESGLYALAVILAAHAHLAFRWSSSRLHAIGYGLLLGLLFWIRNDAVFLIAAACTAHLVLGDSWRRRDMWRRLQNALLIAFASFVVALPWMVYNLLGFGHIVPISGLSLSLSIAFAHNAARIPPILAEYLLAFVPLSPELHRNTAVALFCTPLALLGFWHHGRAWRSADPRERELLLLAFGFALLLSSYYGLFFGAPYFFKRYLFPMSSFLTLFWATALCRVAVRIAPGVWRHALVGSFGAILVVTSGALCWRQYRDGDRHMHSQVVEWVARNVREDQWVGAIQSGTLGFFHDRTLNLDGKVNPYALEARAQHRLAEYAVASKIEYVVDWARVSTWARNPVMSLAFERILHDPKRNLAVLKRRPSPQ